MLSLILKRLSTPSASLFFFIWCLCSYPATLASEEITSKLPKTKTEKKFQKVVKEQKQNHKKAALSQKKVSALASKTRDLVYEHRIVLQQIADARTYNKQLRKFIKNQEEENHFIREQISEVKKTKKEIIPLMLEMYDVLAKFIELDIPFLMEERKNRLKEIQNIMNRANVTLSEKYRRLMEAYSIENEYGRTLEAYHGTENIHGQNVDVHYLRVGRIAFIYQTRDGKQQAYWNQKQKKWIPLASKFKKAIQTALQVAKKRQAPTLLIVPVPAPIKKDGA